MAIIKNYGLRWVRDQVDWGSPGVAGCLSGKRKAKSVDFQDQIGVYILYEPIFNPVYIGQAGFGNATMLGRLRQHRNDHLRDRWSHFSWFGFRDVNKNLNLSDKQDSKASTTITYGASLQEIEGILIQVLEPRLNKKGASWKSTAAEYIQDGLPSEAVRMSRIESQLEKLHKNIEVISNRLTKR